MTCPSTQVYHSQAFLGEVWSWTALGVLIFVARFAVRLRIRSWRKLQGDDYFAVLTLLLFICLMFSKLAMYYLGSNVDYTEESMVDLTDCQMKKVVIGSKLGVGERS
jgi:hypothetical protein